MPSFRFRRPNETFLQQYVENRATLPFTYEEVGRTQGSSAKESSPRGYTVDHTEAVLGHGEELFERAKSALLNLKHLSLGWVEAWTAKVEKDEIVVMMGRVGGMWWLNPCRIIYVAETSGTSREFSFAYGTLPGHVERGEERFSIQWDPETDAVTYNILAFSRPNHLLSSCSYPYVRLLQKQFGRDSSAALFRSLNSHGDVPKVLQSTRH